MTAATLTGTTAPAEPRRLGQVMAELAAGLRAAGLRTGDLLFLHVNLAALGLEDDTDTAAAILATVREALGPDGTVLIPTYTFSFCRQQRFDPSTTPTASGPWSPSAGFLEYFRALPGTVRSIDPIHSVAGLGPFACQLLSNIPATCFGPGSVFARLVEHDALICMLGLDLDEATVRHHTEEVVGVPFRYRKLFTGAIGPERGATRSGWVYNVRILADSGAPDGTRIARAARERGIASVAPVGMGELVAVRAAAFHELGVAMLRNDAWATAAGPAGDAVALEAARVGSGVAAPALAAGASMHELIDALWRLPRDIVSDGYDAALAALATQLPMTVHEYPSGTECWSWIVPEKWTCQEAWLETLDGSRLFSYADHPLHVVSYSLPFEGEVSRDELLRHLHVHPRLPDAVPFVFKYYERDWGLCCTQAQRESLTEPRYRVRIRSSFSYGTLKVGEVVVPGQTSDTIVLCAHLCHPAMVNDDLTGVVVGMDVMRALLTGPTPRYTYRLLIVPETIGSIAHLSQHPELLATLRGGLFLEMLGRDIPHALQLSFAGDTEPDRCFARALRACDPQGWTTPFRTLAGNDERQFNAPGVRVPMLSLTRQLPPTERESPYREYHSSADTPALVPPGALAASRDLVLAMIRELETNVRVASAVPGEICCSRYGIHVDFVEDPAGHRALFDVLFLLDGTRSARDIAETCDVPLPSVLRIIEQLRGHGLVVEH